MNKIAFVFPGQGSQYVAMAWDFCAQNQASKEVFEASERATGLEIKKICFEEDERLFQTRYTQPVLLTACMAIYKAVCQELQIKPDYTAGLSLGEYSALVCAGVLSFEDAVDIVSHRGAFMEEAYPTGGAMTAVLTKGELPMEEILKQVTSGVVTVANYNCPGQRVISGEQAAVDEGAALLKEAGARRLTPLKVDGPFHSPLLASAGKQLRDYIETKEFHAPEIGFISNVTAKAVTDVEEIKDLLGKQVCSSVLWEQSVEEMIRQGVDTFIEIGPGKTLTKFAARINKEVTAYSIQNMEDLAKLKEVLNQ